MKLSVLFYVHTGHDFDTHISKAFQHGVIACGDYCEQMPIEDFVKPRSNTDVAVFMGARPNSHKVYDSHLAANKHTIIIDKGYTRIRIRGGPLKTTYWRMSIDSFQPHTYLFSQLHDNKRWDATGLTIKHMQPRTNGQILFCGGSQKYCDWHKLGDANDYARAILQELAQLTQRKLVYRPKPSWSGAKHLKEASFSGGDCKYRDELLKTFHTVTFGSNAAIESLLLGVPVLVLGDGIARSLARTKLSEIETPYYPSYEEVYRLACAVAYCQWTMTEMVSGEAWRHIRQTLITLLPAKIS
jgi:hypothetical protein